MYKIIFFGKLDQTMEILYKSMYREYQIQFCTEISKTMQTMVRIVNPDMLLLHIAEAEELSDRDIEIMKTMYSNIPIVFIAEKQIFDTYDSFCNRENVYCIQRPVATSGVKTQCEDILKQWGKSPDRNDEEETRKKCILVVDDGAIILRSLKALLEGKYEVAVATSGEMAYRRMEKSLPDLVLLDYEMPGWNGKETLEKIRENESMKDVPVIFLTGMSDKKYITDVLHLNPMGYILKPPDKDKLFEAIEAALG